jgi:hypothetical protein
MITGALACDNGRPTGPITFGAPQFSMESCDLPDNACAELDSLLALLVDYYPPEHDCNHVVTEARGRFDSDDEGVGFKYGGTSTTIYGYTLSTHPETTFITSKGLGDLGPTAIHEEGHHQGIPNTTVGESAAEALGLACGVTH